MVTTKEEKNKQKFVVVCVSCHTTHTTVSINPDEGRIDFECRDCGETDTQHIYVVNKNDLPN